MAPWALFLAGTLALGEARGPETAEDAPWVEIAESTGAIAGAGDPQWERVRLDLKIQNRLPVSVDQIVVVVSLVSKPHGAAEEPIPGWRLEHAFEDAAISANELSTLHLDRSLPVRRRIHSAAEIAYRAQLVSYRVTAPSLELACRLLESPAASDQRAALLGYQRLGESGASLGVAETVVREIARAIADPPRDPDPSAALRLLVAQRAAGLLGLQSLVPLLLAMPERVDPERWGPALSDLAARMVDGSSAEEPRLEVLPAWARTAEEPLGDRGSELIAWAAHDAILRIGDPGVPELVRASALGDTDLVRARATAALRALGRASVRSQLAISDPDTRLRLIEVYGEVGAGEPVAALAEMVSARHGSEREAATAALQRIGPAAVQPLVDALATPDAKARAAMIAVLEAIGAPGRKELLAGARRWGISVDLGGSVHLIARRLAERLAATARARSSNEITRALGLARSGDYEEAFRILDAIYGADPELYMLHADPIARAYLQRAQALYARGNFDAALETLRTGQTVQRLPEMAALMRDAQLSLARGFLGLDQIDRAEEALDAAALPASDGESRELRAQILLRKAEVAFQKGEYGKARSLVDRARTLAPQTEASHAMSRRLLLAENLGILVVLGLVVPGLAVMVVVFLRRRIQAARIAELADRG